MLLTVDLIFALNSSQYLKYQFWSKNNRRTIETRVTWAYTRVGLYVAVYGQVVGLC